MNQNCDFICCHELVQEGMILEEWATSDIYSVNKKVKDGSKVEPSPYSYPDIWLDSVTDLYHVMFYTAALDCLTWHTIRQKTHWTSSLKDMI